MTGALDYIQFVLAPQVLVGLALAGIGGMRHLRKLVSGRSFGVVQLDGSQYTDVAEPGGSDYTNVVQLDSNDYAEVR